MAFCVKCGASLAENVSFCGKCGSPVSGGETAHKAAAGGLAPNQAAALSYVLGFITGILFLVIEPYKNDRYVRFHAFQSIFFSAAWMIFWILWNNLFWFTLSSFSLIGILGLISSLVGLAVLLYWLFLMYKAYNNERYMIPIIGEIAARQAG